MLFWLILGVLNIVVLIYNVKDDYIPGIFISVVATLLCIYNLW